MGIEAAFGWDADTNKIVTVIGQDSSGADAEITPYVSISFYSEDFSESCVVFYSAVDTELDPANWTGANSFGSKSTDIDHTGFVLATGSDTAAFQTDCDNLDPDVYGDIEANLGAYAFGGGIGNVHDDVEPNLADIAAGSEIEESVLFGGGWYIGEVGGAVADGQYLAANFAIGFAVDADKRIIVDDSGNATFLQAADVVNDTGVPPTGYYRSIPAFVFDAGVFALQ